jgi:N-acetylmuramic acid 6-phosphate (MurNAc-6-P) etherase
MTFAKMYSFQLVMNTISMIRLGKTIGNLMVDVFATNERLRARVHRIVRKDAARRLRSEHPTRPRP